MEELKPCPFCGSEAYIVEVKPHSHIIATFMPDYEGGAFVECTGCTCALSAESKEEAIVAWNRRVKDAK